jgi:hypothetical protein
MSEKNELPDKVYNLNDFIGERLLDNPNESVFALYKERPEELRNIVGKLLKAVKITSDKSSEQILGEVEVFLDRSDIDDRTKNMIISLIDGGLAIAHRVIDQRSQTFSSLQKELNESLKELEEDKDDEDVRENIVFTQDAIKILQNASFEELKETIEEEEETLDLSKRTATRNEVDFIRTELQNTPDDVRVGINAKLAALFELSPEEVVRIAHEKEEEKPLAA